MSRDWSMEKTIQVFDSDFNKNNEIVKTFVKAIIKAM